MLDSEEGVPRIPLQDRARSCPASERPTRSSGLATLPYLNLVLAMLIAFYRTLLLPDCLSGFVTEPTLARLPE